MGDLRSAASGKAAMIRLATKSGQHPECLNRSGGHGWGCGTGRAEMDKGERARRWSHECCTPKRIFFHSIWGFLERRFHGICRIGESGSLSAVTPSNNSLPAWLRRRGIHGERFPCPDKFLEVRRGRKIRFSFSSSFSFF